MTAASAGVGPYGHDAGGPGSWIGPAALVAAGPASGRVRDMTVDATPGQGDAELVARIAAGDEAAFAVVYDRHADIVYGSVMRFVRDRELAEEVVQDAYVAVWRNAAQYAPGTGSLLGWLLGIARNKAIDRLRATARRPRLVVLGGSEERQDEELDRIVAAGGRVEGSAAADTGPEEATTRAWTRAVVRSALSAMPDLERQALVLAYDEGLSQTEIAGRLGWPLGTVKTRTRRGLAALRTVLEGVPELIDDSGAAMAPTAAAAHHRSLGGPDGPR